MHIYMSGCQTDPVNQRGPHDVTCGTIDLGFAIRSCMSIQNGVSDVHHIILHVFDIFIYRFSHGRADTRKGAQVYWRAGGQADGRTGGRADGRAMGRRVDGRTGGQVDGRTGGRADGQTGRQPDGRADLYCMYIQCIYIYTYKYIFICIHMYRSKSGAQRNCRTRFPDFALPG